MKQNLFNQSLKDVMQFFGVHPERGLRDFEVEERHRRDGYNEFAKAEHTSIWMKFISQFKSFMIIVLLIAAVISGVTGYLNGEGITDALIILVILVVNAIIGVFQEDKAEKSLEALEKLSAPKCKVIREGVLQVIESRELVVGDVVVIETGDSIPADLRLIESSNLKVQESALTGESVPVEKDAMAVVGDDATIGDRVNMAYSSCSVTYGHGKGIVCAIGTDTEVGKIASMIQSVQNTRTPLQIKLDQLGKALSIICLAICGVILVVGLCYGRNLMDMFMTAVSLAVAAIPEGLPAVSTVVLALGVQRLAKQNAIVRNLPSVETLGSTTVICSDKTGTLTQNKMTVTEVFMQSPELLQVAVLANDATLDGNRSIGDPTETALLGMGIKQQVIKAEVEKGLPRIAEVPFDSERKLMSTIHQKEDGKLLVAVKGGLDEILERCKYIFDNQTIRPITERDIQYIRLKNEDMASRALRVLAMAQKEIAVLPSVVDSASVENELIFLGMVGMIDPPREEAKLAVAQCKEAGIRPVMITGDHKITATAIAQALGIFSKGDSVYTGVEVAAMNDDELREAVATTSVFARVAPEHKVRIVKAFQERSNVVAMTGDGVNDAPALKLANIGVAMGITGTDVAKEAADVVLADDNFATIVSAVREGRRIFDNLMKSIQFMISTNLAEILLLLVAVICNWDMPLLPLQLLFINLVGDSMPALAISVDHAEKDIMQRKPVKPNQGIFTKKFTWDVLARALIVGVSTIAAFLIGEQVSVDVGRTMAFAVMIFAQFTIIFSIRSGKQWFGYRLFSNRFLWLTLVLVICMTIVVMLVPTMQEMFYLAALNAAQWWTVLGLSVGTLVLSEAYKMLRR